MCERNKDKNITKKMTSGNDNKSGKPRSKNNSDFTSRKEIQLQQKREKNTKPTYNPRYTFLTAVLTK